MLTDTVKQSVNATCVNVCEYCRFRLSGSQMPLRSKEQKMAAKEAKTKNEMVTYMVTHRSRVTSIHVRKKPS